MLVATGMSKPVGRSNRSAGPPPGDLQARSVTAAISRSGLTGSPMRESRCRFSRSRRRSVRSEYTAQSYPVRSDLRSSVPSVVEILSWPLIAHLIRDLLRERQRAASLGAADQRLPPGAHGVDEIRELARERLLVDDLELAAFDRRHRAAPLHEPPQ